MSNRGVIGGVRIPGWQSYTPNLREFSNAGTGITQPSLGNSIAVARWMRDPSGKVFYYGQITFGSTATFGSGGSVWGLTLPYPASRSSGGADLPIGTAMAWQGTASNRNMVLTPTLMDPLSPGGTNGAEDDYAQFFCSRLVASGTGSIASAATSTTITHGLANTPTATDIRITPTATTTNNCGIWYVDTIGSSTFNVNVKAAPGASTFAFSWKAEVDPNNSSEFDLLAAHNKPWTWAANHVLGWSLVYEGRR